MLTIAERATLPLDRGRAALLRIALGVGWLRAWLVRRDRRIALIASLGIISAFTLSLFAPALLYATTPIVLGVPHVASDVRYLVVRQRLARWLVAAIVIWCVGLLGVRVVEMIFGMPAARVELMLVATGAIALAAHATYTRREAGLTRGLIVIAILLTLTTVSWVFPETTRLVLAHAHNLIAIAIWLVLFRRGGAIVGLPLALLIVTSALILCGATAGLVPQFGAHDAVGTDLISVAAWLAPGLGNFGVSLTLAYVFWQAIHYSVWLGWIPQEETRGQGSLTFRQSLRSLVGDFGWLGITFVALGTGTMLFLATRDLQRTRDTYLFLAGFHAYLEIAMLGYLWIAATKKR